MSRVTDGRRSAAGLCKPIFFLGLGALILCWLYSSIRESANRNTSVGVDISGVQHIGPDFSIPRFYVDGYNGFNVSRESLGGGGGDVCCVYLPQQWRPGLSVDLRWEVNDWSRENLQEIAKGNYQSVRLEGVYRAIVPVEKYKQADQVWVHFFAGGKARVVVGWPGPGNLNHPIQHGDSHAADTAAIGKRIDDIFSREELAAMKRNEEERKKTYGGDWK